MVQFEIKLFGDLLLSNSGKPIELRGRNERRLLALLALQLGKPLLRTQIAEALWPDTDYAVTGNRLRAALAGLRRVLGASNLIESEGPFLQLRPQNVVSDLQEASKLYKRRHIVASLAEEAASLDRLLQIISPGLLIGWSEGWLTRDQDHWANVRQRSLVRMAELALQLEDPDSAVSHSGAAIEAQPQDEEAWSAYLIAMARTGAGKEAARHFKTHSRRRRSNDEGPFSESLEALAASVGHGLNDGGAGWPVVPIGVESALMRGLLRLLSTEPATAARFVTTDTFRLEMLRIPKSSIRFLESLLLTLPPATPERIAVEIMALRLHSVCHQVEEVISYGERLLATPLDPVQKRLVLSQVSFAYYLVRNMDRATSLIEQALDVARQHASPHHLQLTRADQALYLWHNGRDVEAQAVFEEVLKAVEGLPATQVSYAPAYLSGLIGTILLWRGETNQAATWLRDGYGLAKKGRYLEQVHQIEPHLGLAMARLGSPDQGGRHVISSLAHFSKSGNIRAFAATLDTMAAVFCLMSAFDAAQHCYEAGTVLRARSRHSRSPAEEAFARSFSMHLSAAANKACERQDHDPSGLLNWITRHFYRESDAIDSH